MYTSDLIEILIEVVINQCNQWKYCKTRYLTPGDANVVSAPTSSVDDYMHIIS